MASGANLLTLSSLFEGTVLGMSISVTCRVEHSLCCSRFISAKRIMLLAIRTAVVLIGCSQRSPVKGRKGKNILKKEFLQSLPKSLLSGIFSLVAVVLCLRLLELLSSYVRVDTWTCTVSISSL